MRMMLRTHFQDINMAPPNHMCHPESSIVFQSEAWFHLIIMLLLIKCEFERDRYVNSVFFTCAT